MALLADATARSAVGDHAASRGAYRQAIRIAPNRADLWHNVGALCATQGAYDEAIAALSEAARLRPDWAEPLHARGHVLHASGNLEGARAAFEAALVRDPTHLAARVNLALTFNRLQRYSLALPLLLQAREQAPADEDIWWLTRSSLLRLRRDEEALADFLRFEPFVRGSARTAVAALWAARRLADSEREKRALAAALSFPYAPGDSALLAEALALVQYHDIPPESLFDLYRTHDRVVRAELQAAGDATSLQQAAGQRRSGDEARIRIGYLSADFRSHVMGEMLAPILAAHDRRRFSIRLYSLAPQANEDTLTERVRALADAFVRLADDDEVTAARRIAGDGVD